MGSTVVFAEDNYIGGDHKYMLGSSFPNLGWAQYNDDGLLTGYTGFNLTVGYSAKYYFTPGMKADTFNTYWGWGTLFVILPYVEAGVDYPFAEAKNGSFWTVTGSVGLYCFIPAPSISLSYRF
jgi:hypothetical protein